MRKHLWLVKELWNDLLEFIKYCYAEFGYFPTKRTLREMAKASGLYSQVGQDIVRRLVDALWRFMELKKQDKLAGFPRFKSFNRVKSLCYPQYGFSLREKLAVTPFGEIKIRKHRPVPGRLKTLSLKREASGKWFAICTAEEEAVKFKSNGKGVVGIDLGLNSFATLSNGESVANPRVFQKEELRLARMQRGLSKKKKGGRNRAKECVRVARVHERIANVRTDFLHKLSSRLVGNYSLIALEKLEVKQMAENRFGKQILDASWGRLTGMLCYKAASAGCKIVFVNPRYTSMECSSCGFSQSMPLNERTYNCPACGMVKDRDENAAINILAKATAGTAERNAWGDDTIVSSVNQDASR